MPDKNKQTVITPALYIAVIVLAGLVIWRVAFFTPSAQSKTQDKQTKTMEQQSKTQEQPSQTDSNQEHPPSIPPAENKEESPKTTVDKAEKANIELNVEPKTSLNDVIKAARSWGPAYTSWYGKQAPDLTLNDINGKKHKLSDYKGKDVMITFWATWCGPCIMEVPHLIALRNIISKDKLAMLAISNEKPTLVKQFVADKKINYTVLTIGTASIPAPYNQVNGIPCSFFIDSKGRIKLATEGMLPLGDIKAILQAK